MRLKPATRNNYLAVVVLALVIAASGCTIVRIVRNSSMLHPGKILVTGYCNCGTCCGWKELEDGRTVYTYGSMKGQEKRVGVTSRGTVAKHGTIAADLKYFRYGTKLSIPGYGEGVVEDIGGAIKGNHIDLWFPTHREAKAWGAKWLKVEVLK